MSAKSMESVIRELNKTVNGLQNKVASLEDTILDLKTQLIRNSENGEPVTKGSSDVVESKNAPQTTQRTTRDARIRAISAISVIARKEKRGRNVSPLLTESVGLVVPTEATQSSPNDSAPPTPTVPMVQPLTTGRTTHTCLDELNVNNGAEWSEVKQRRSHRSLPTNATRGTAAPGSSACLLSAAERKSYLHLYYVKIGTTAEQVMDHLNTICPNDKCNAEVLKSRGDYASFKLTVSTKNVNEYLLPAHWPEDVFIKPWRSGFRKPLQATQEN